MGGTAAIILAAGRGSRMRSGLAKALHELGGLPLVEHVIRAVKQSDLPDPWVVTGYQADRVEDLLEGKASFVRQPDMHGTADALYHALAQIPTDYDDVLVLLGDSPLIPVGLIHQLLEKHRTSQAWASIVTTIMPNPSGYGRIVRSPEGNVTGIVEDREANGEVRRIQEINTGMGIWKIDGLRQILNALPWHGDERYLTDAIEVLVSQGKIVKSLVWPDPDRVMGINSRRDLAQAEAILRQVTLDRLFDQGVTIVDPASTYVDADVEVGQDTILYPMTFLRGNTKVGRECQIGPMASVVSSRLGDGVVVDRSVVEQSVLSSKVKVGPFSHIRAGTYLDRDVKIGNFVELKNTRVGIGTKAGHHSYLGDATIGGRVNIGAGTVIVNFDGIAKHPTFIGDEAFIGCNANLVAPVEIGPGSYVAAGSTITQNVPGEALGIARSRQENKADWTRSRKGKTGDRPPKP